MVAIMVADILSATTTRAAEPDPGADTDGSAGDSEADEESADAEADEESADVEADEEPADAEADEKPADAEADEESADNEAGTQAPVSFEAKAETASAEDTESSAVEGAGADAKPQETADASTDAGLTLVVSRIHLRVYGFLNAQLEMAQAIGGTTPYSTRGRISDGNSRLGFSGFVDITKGLQAVWQIEGCLANFEQGGINDRGLLATIVSRNTFVGVEQPVFGRLVFGYNDSVYRSMVGSAGAFGGNLGLTRTGLDLWNNTTAQMSGNPDSLFSRGEARFANSAHYTTPLFYGFQLGASFSFDEVPELERFRNRVSAGLTWEHAVGFKIGAGYDYQTNTGVDQEALFEGEPFSMGTADDVSTSFAKVLAGYVNSRTKTSVAAGVEYAMYGYSSFIYLDGYDMPPELREGTMSQLSSMASASQGLPFGLTLMVSGGKLWKLFDNDTVEWGNMMNADTLVGSPGDYEAWQVSGGIKYMFGDHFTTYLYYTHIVNESRQNVNFGQAPLYTNNIGTSEAYLSPGDSPRALGIGVLARF
jgi:predicted porin